MPLFDDIVNDVYTVTNRPDLVAETALMVRQATLIAHHSDVFFRDLTEIAVPFSPATATPSIDVTTVFPRWRQFKYIRPWDPLTGSTSDLLIEIIDPTAIFDEYLAQKVNVAYVAGTNLNIRFAAAQNGVLVGYYQNPVLQPSASYASWIASENSDVIVAMAAARVLQMIGYEDAAARWKNLAAESLQVLKNTNIEAEGR